MNKKVQIAFTLIELLVVIAIIGILSGLIIVTMNGVTQKANIAKAQIFNNSLRNALMMNLVSEWKFDGTTADGSAATANDVLDIWGGNNGTVDGLTVVKTGSSCVLGSCLSFDGINNYISISDSVPLRLTTGGTISAWIYPETAGESNAGRIVSKYTTTAGYSTQISGSTFYIAINGVSTTSNPVLALNAWQLITFTFDGTGRKIYVNGVNQTAVGGSETVLPSDTSGIIIGDRNTFGRAFDGLMDDIRIYNVAVPTSQIKEQYYLGLNSLFSNGSISKQEYAERLSGLAQGLQNQIN